MKTILTNLQASIFCQTQLYAKLSSISPTEDTKRRDEMAGHPWASSCWVEQENLLRSGIISTQVS